MATEVYAVRDQQGLDALGHPTRVQILEALREPASAAEVARRIGQPRQRTNHHLHALEEAGLVRRVGERRTGNFVATLYEAVARAFVVSPQVAWADPRRLEAMRSQHSLETLVLLGERLQSDAAALLDRAAFDGAQIASAAVQAELRFSCEEDRAAFMKDYLESLSKLVERYASKEGEGYRAVLAVYPEGSES